MTSAALEHVNIEVSDADKTAGLLCALFDWRVRWRGEAASGGRTVHVGTEGAYVAVHQPPGPVGAPLAHRKGAPLNHVGVEVGDLAETERRVAAAGLKPFGHGDYTPGRRFYFFDWDQIEWEVVSYAAA